MLRMYQRKDLTEKEKRILDLIKQGVSNKEIASKLNINKNTVSSYKRNINIKVKNKPRLFLAHSNIA